jgi:hypothetical protein
VTHVFTDGLPVVLKDVIDSLLPLVSVISGQIVNQFVQGKVAGVEVDNGTTQVSGG